MEDRFLFKAKRVDNGEWVVGFYTYIYKKHYIYTGQIISGGLYDIAERFEVDPSTICRCTGLKDKNGNLVWENDIAKYENDNFYKVFWQNNHYQFSWVCVKSDVFSIGTKWDLWRFKSSEIEVVGSVVDNAELLESEETNGQCNRKPENT